MRCFFISSNTTPFVFLSSFLTWVRLFILPVPKPVDQIVVHRFCYFNFLNMFIDELVSTNNSSRRTPSTIVFDEDNLIIEEYSLKFPCKCFCMGVEIIFSIAKCA